MKRQRYILLIATGIISIAFLCFGGIFVKHYYRNRTLPGRPITKESVMASKCYWQEGISFVKSEDVQPVSSIEDDFSIWYSELWAKYLEPITTEVESDLLKSIDWDERIRPYMEYDWISDERIEKNNLSINSWVMQLADLNLDGTPEMLVSEYCDRMAEDYTYVFTIQEGKVLYCGKIIASIQFMENEFFGDLEYLPSYYIDIYQNADGEFRYLSCDDFLMAAHGEYWIYESTFDGTSISGNLAYMMNFAEGSGGTKHCRYASGDKLGDNYLDYYENYNENAVVDDEAYSDFCRVMEAYMQGYQRVDISFTVSEYRIPATSGALSSEQQEIVRKNIVAGFARALGYLDKE